VTIGGDPQHRVALAEGAPERPALTGKPPAGLVHVERLGATDPVEQIRVGQLERVAGALQDRLDAAGADPCAEELLAELDDIAARDAVAHRQRRDRGLQPRAERAPGDLGGQPAGLPCPAGRAAHALAAMLDHPRRDHRQLLDLVTRRRAERHALGRAEQMPTRAGRRPMLDHLVDRRARQQIATASLMTRLGALAAW
jgi:hypothetical protein